MRIFYFSQSFWHFLLNFNCKRVTVFVSSWLPDTLFPPPSALRIIPSAAELRWLIAARSEGESAGRGERHPQIWAGTSASTEAVAPYLECEQPLTGGARTDGCGWGFHIHTTQALALTQWNSQHAHKQRRKRSSERRKSEEIWARRGEILPIKRWVYFYLATRGESEVYFTSFHLFESREEAETCVTASDRCVYCRPARVAMKEAPQLTFTAVCLAYKHNF